MSSLSRTRAREFKPVNLALAGQRFIQFPLAAEQSQQQMRAQLLAIINVLVTRSETVDRKDSCLHAVNTNVALSQPGLRLDNAVMP
jgi:hypothetical protein